MVLISLMSRSKMDSSGGLRVDVLFRAPLFVNGVVRYSLNNRLSSQTLTVPMTHACQLYVADAMPLKIYNRRNKFICD